MVTTPETEELWILCDFPGQLTKLVAPLPSASVIHDGGEVFLALAFESVRGESMRCLCVIAPGTVDIVGIAQYVR